MKPRIGILLGDATGIGPEVVVKVCTEKVIFRYCRPILIGDIRVLKSAMDICRADFLFTRVSDLTQVDWSGPISIFDSHNLDPAEIELGKPSKKSGKVMGELFEIALQLVKSGDIDGFSFAPYNKDALDSAGVDIFKLFPRYLKVKWPFGEINVVNNIWISRVTSHIPLSEVSKKLNKRSIMGAIRLLHDTMIRGGIQNPRIAVAALNPHGGDNGLFGREEIDVIIPAIRAAEEEQMNVVGPFPADTIFVNALNGQYEGITTMYHDQGLIALKLINFYSALTIIAGLSCPITTPAHGTAFDIVGKGVANHRAMEQAIITAARMSSWIL